MAGAPGAGGGELSSPRRSARQPTTPLSPARSSGAAHIFSPAASQPMALAAAQQQQQRSTIEVLLSAVGVGLQFVHLDGAAAHGGSRPGSSAGSRPGSVAGSWQDSAVHSRQGSGIDLEVAASQALAAGASSGALAGGRRATQAQGAQAQPGAARAVQMLAANFDLELSYRLQARVVWAGGGMGRPAVQAVSTGRLLLARCAALLALVSAARRAAQQAELGPPSQPSTPLCAPLHRLLCRTSSRAGGWRCRASGWRRATSKVVGERAPLCCLQRKPPSLACPQQLHWPCLHAHNRRSFPSASVPQQQKNTCAVRHPGRRLTAPPLQTWRRAWRSATSRTPATSASCGASGRPLCWTPAA